MAAVTDEQVIGGWLDELFLKDMPKKSASNYHSCVRVYQCWLKKQDLSVLDVQGKKDRWILERFLKYLRTDYRKPDGGIMSYGRLKMIFTGLNSLYDYLEYKDLIEKNMVLPVRKRYLKQYKKGYVPAQRKVIDVREMAGFINSVANVRDKAMIVVGVKTGIRRGELISLDVSDVDLEEMKITLDRSCFHKRTNHILFFDDEAKQVLLQWLKRRGMYVKEGETALFLGVQGRRISRNASYDAMAKWATRYGLHNPNSKRLEDHFTFHNLRHCFTTYMRKNKMPREFIQELRGDKRRDTIDIYDHIDLKELKREYMSCVPQFHIN